MTGWFRRFLARRRVRIEAECERRYLDVVVPAVMVARRCSPAEAEVEARRQYALLRFVECAREPLVEDEPWGILAVVESDRDPLS